MSNELSFVNVEALSSKAPYGAAKFLLAFTANGTLGWKCKYRDKKTFFLQKISNSNEEAKDDNGTEALEGAWDKTSSSCEGRETKDASATAGKSDEIPSNVDGDLADEDRSIGDETVSSEVRLETSLSRDNPCF